MHAVQDHYADPIFDSMVSREIIIDNRENSSELESYQVDLVIDESQLFFEAQESLRFVDENLKIMNHWNESFPNKQWIQVSKICANAMTPLRKLEDNTSSTSNGEGTFIFFDDFELTKTGLIFKSEKHGAGSPNYLDHAEGISTDGTYVYVTSFLDDSLSIFQTNAGKTTLSLLWSSGNSSGSPNYLNGAHDSWLEGNYLYICSMVDNALTIFNVSNPASPSHVGEIHGAGSPNYLSGAVSLWVEGNYAYVTAYYDNSLTIIDISTPSSPSFVSSISGAGSPNYLSHATKIIKEGNLVYISTALDHSLTIFDVSTPSSPSHVGEIHGAGSPNYLQNSWGIVKKGNYILVAASGDDRLTVIDVSTPASPSHVISISERADFIDNLAMDGNYLYAACIDENGISIYDITDPTNPSYYDGIYGVGSPNYLAACHNLCINEGYVYQVARDDDAISIFKIGDVATIDTDKWSTGGSPTISNSILTCETSEWVKEKYTHTYNVALRAKTKFVSGTGDTWIGFRDGSSTPIVEFVRVNDTDWWARTHVSATEKTDLDTGLLGSFHTYELSRLSDECKFLVDGVLKHTSTTQIPTTALPAEIWRQDLSGSIQCDWLFIRKYTSPEPTASIGAMI